MTTTVSSVNKTKLPRGPKLPGFILTMQALIDQFGLLEKTQKKYGDFVYTRKSLGFPPYVILSNPQAIEEVLTANPKIFAVGQKSSLPIRALLGDNSLVLLDGVEHKRQRKLLMPPFHGERMKSYGDTIIDVTQKAIAPWEMDKPFCIRDYTQDISLRVILRTIFGLDEGKRYEKLRTILVSWLDIFNNPLNSFFLFFRILQQDLGAWSPWGKFVRQKQAIHEILNSEINHRRDNPETLGDDILSLLLNARYENNEPMSDEEIRDELMTMLFGGHETTANALAWAFYWIHDLPEVKQKLMAELNSLEGNKDFNAIMKLPYLNAVVSETLRIHPVIVFLSRHLKEPFEIMGYQIDAGTTLFPSIYLVHQREDIYPEPKKFKPERFLEKQFSPYEYLPFGGGHRRCLGYAFALFEMKLVLATILSEVQLELLDNRLPKPLRRGIAFSPSGGIKMTVKSNKNLSY